MELRDPQIREQLKAGLEARLAGRAHTMVVDELSLGFGEVRADVAVISPERLVGYEIKSDFDSLVRLENQIQYYNMVFDHCYLICGNKYVEKALKMLPDHWGLFTLTALRVHKVSGQSGDDYKLKFRRVREAQDHEGIDASTVVRLLRRDEVLQELRLRGLGAMIRSKKGEALQDLLALSVSHGEMRRIVARRLSQRVGWR
jgi:hypothetical protein